MPLYEHVFLSRQDISQAQVEAQAKEYSQVIEEGGARVFVDSDAATILGSAELDARRDGDQVAFGLTPSGASSNGSH